MREMVKCTVESSVAMVCIDRPKALNALNPQVLTELYEVMCELDADKAVRAVILTGAGEKAFVAGADIAAMQNMTPEQAVAFSRLGHRTMDKIAAMRAVTIAAIQGFALGGGCELAMACDIRVASTAAKMGIPEVTLGVIPGFGGTQRLPRLVGRGKAMELLATGRQCKGPECLQIGLVDILTEPEDLMETCQTMAAKIARNSASAIDMGKRCICSGMEMDLTKALEMEQNSFALTFATADQKEGMTAFLEKRKANFK